MIGRLLVLALPAGVVTLAGCTHHQLNRSMVPITGTVMDIQYRVVLMNLAKLSCQPEPLPDHADLADGFVQINDRLGFGDSGGFTFITGQSGFGLEWFGPSGQRQITEQWGADATTDPQRLIDLQELYRAALGLPALPPPHAIAYLRGQRDQAAPRSGDKPPSGMGPTDTNASGVVQMAMSREAPSKPSSGASPESYARRVPIEILLIDVPPPGWFHVGKKQDVPRDACYVSSTRVKPARRPSGSPRMIALRPALGLVGPLSHAR
jgi:hypothetical protein